MNPTCNKLQLRLVEEGLAVLKSDEHAQAHLATCDDCHQVLLSLQEIDVQLLSLPNVEPPEELIQSALAQTLVTPEPVEQPKVETAVEAPTATPASRAQTPTSGTIAVAPIETAEPVVNWRQAFGQLWAALAGMMSLFFGSMRKQALLVGVGVAVIAVVGGLTMTFLVARGGRMAMNESAIGQEETLEGSEVYYLAEGGDEDEEVAPDLPSRHAQMVDEINGAYDRRAAAEAEPYPSPSAPPVPSVMGGSAGISGLGSHGSGQGGGGVGLGVGLGVGRGATGRVAEPARSGNQRAIPGQVGSSRNAYGGTALPPAVLTPTEMAAPQAARDAYLAEANELLAQGYRSTGGDRWREGEYDYQLNGRMEQLDGLMHDGDQLDLSVALGDVGSEAYGWEEPAEEERLARVPFRPDANAEESGLRIDSRPSSANLGFLANMEDGEYELRVIEEPDVTVPPAGPSAYRQLGPLSVDAPDDDLSTDSLNCPTCVDSSSTSSFRISSQEEIFARDFLAERERVDELAFREATGYWQNTYVPGDPVLREIQRRLRTDDEAAIAVGQSNTGFALANNAETYSQPFDPPTHSALSVYLHADRTGVQGESRALVQVGIQGTARQSGRRPAMNIGVVLDLRDSIDAMTAASVRALVEAMAEARDVGDRFSLVVAGRPGGVVIPSDSFRYGPVRIALAELLDEDVTGTVIEPGVTLDLVDAFTTAVDLVRAADDPTAPLGSSLVLLVTPSALSGEDRAIESFAHLSAVDGIPVSVVGVGTGVDLNQLDRIALAGQGNRRLMSLPAEATDVLERELSSLSRVVARAIRLRIRLAPGVELVNVLGSQRLDEVNAERVREAEQSIDQRLSRNLGIQADRGEDEEGIQIVIPAFYADDTHTVLLDVTVPGPGPVADVTVRYKDLVFVRNGVARDNLRLGRDLSAPGPLEVNVIKNLVAFEIAESLTRAGSWTATHEYEHARLEMDRALGLLRGLQTEVPGFTTDPELESDIIMVSQYLDLLGSVSTGVIAPPNDLADSLLYAGYRKLLSPVTE